MATEAERSKRYRDRHPGIQIEKTKRWRETHPEKIKDIRLRYALRRKYGMTLEEYDAILAAQGGVCAICGGPPVGPGGRYHVDHDHVSGSVRGLLCGTCNTGLGQFKDSSELLSKAVAYLKRVGK